MLMTFKLIFTKEKVICPYIYIKTQNYYINQKKIKLKFHKTVAEMNTEMNFIT